MTDSARVGSFAPIAATRLAFGLAAMGCGQSPETEQVLVVRQSIEDGGASALAGGSSGTSGDAGVTGGVTVDAGGASSTSSMPSISSFVTISELKIDPPSTDGNNEYIELEGEPGTTLGGYWLVIVEGDSEANLGQVDKVIELPDSCLVGSNGYCLLVAAENAVSAVDLSTPTCVTTALVHGGLENGTGFLGIYSGAPVPAAGADWDADDNGVLEAPAGAVEQDAITWTDGDSGDALYASVVVGPSPLAQVAWRCDIEGQATYFFGLIVGDSTSLVADVAHFSPEGATELLLTPGGRNSCQTATAGAAGASAGGASADLTEIGGAFGSGGEPSGGGSAGCHTATSGGNESGNASSGGAQATETSILVTSSNSDSDGGESGWWAPNPYGENGGDGGSAPDGASGSSGAAGQSASSDMPDVPGGCSIGPEDPPFKGGWLMAVMSLLYLRWCRARPVKTRVILA